MEYRIATPDEVAKQFDWLIEQHKHDPLQEADWTRWKKETISDVKSGLTIPYYGFIEDTCICEAYAKISKLVDYDLIKKNRPYLFAFRTRKDYQGQHYFTGLFNYMILDLKSRGYLKVSVGVESTETKNKEIYKHYGFNYHLVDIPETYSDGSEHIVEYYEKIL